MNKSLLINRLENTIVALCLGWVLFSSVAQADDRGPRIARVLWQDRDKETLMWGEVHGCLCFTGQRFP